MFRILQYAEYAECEPCTIFLHILFHILHIDFHTAASYLTYSSYLLQYGEYAEYEPCTIFLHISSEIPTGCTKAGYLVHISMYQFLLVCT
jgi:hypothetical protein